MADDFPTLFIVGAQRSGTTWLQRLLLEDPRCCGSQESHFFASFGQVLRDFDRKASFERPHGLACYWKRDDLQSEIRRLWKQTTHPLLDRNPDAQWIVEKTPDHALWMDVIDVLLPRSRFVHVIRDSRAVVASLLRAGREPWGQGWAPRSAREAAHRWLGYVEAAEREGGPLGDDRFIQVRYEDLEDDTAGELTRLMRFLELETDEASARDMAEKQDLGTQRKAGGTRFEMIGELEGASPPEPGGFFRPDSSRGWKSELSRMQQRTVWRTTGAMMTQLGYTR